MHRRTKWTVPLLISLLLAGIHWTVAGVDLSKIGGLTIGLGNSNSAALGAVSSDDIRPLQVIEQPVYVVTKSGISQEDAERLRTELGIPTWPNPADFSGNDVVDFNDLDIFASYWLTDDCNSDCGGTDLDGDGKVDSVDYGIFAYYWRQGRISPVWVDNGAAMFINPDKFQAVPMNPIDPCSLDPNLLYTEDGEVTLFEGFDFDAIANIVPLSDSNALNRFQTALADANLTPQALLNPEPVIGHSRFQAVELDGEPIVDVNIDTQVDYNFSLDEIPLVGPGAKVRVSFDPNGNATQLVYSLRELEMGGNVSIITPAEANERFAQSLGDLNDVQLDEPQLVYYAPPLPENNVALIIPHYECGGTATINGHEVTLLRRLIPATDDPNFVPTVELSVEVQDGNYVIAEAQVSGGNGPYSYVWGSSLDITDYNFPDDANRIQYTVTVDCNKEVMMMQETITVVVLDENATSDCASVIVVVDPVFELPAGPGICDFGTERGVHNMCLQNQSDFINGMIQGGAYSLFNWANENAWERDFKDPACHPNGLDNFYVDNVDMAFYMGHGNPQYFTFDRSQQDDDQLTCADAAVSASNLGGWGNQNLEWLALLSCNVLQHSDGGQTYAQRWGPAFNGLHLLLGFHTGAYDEPGFGSTFAKYVTGRRAWLWRGSMGGEPEYVWWPAPMSIRAAWFQATLLTQPFMDYIQAQEVTAAVMGTCTTGATSSNMNNYNDYFHGKGPVGPDISRSSIAGYWYVTCTVVGPE